MAVQALSDPQHIGHLYGDVLGLIVVAAVLRALTARPSSAQWVGERQERFARLL